MDHLSGCARGHVELTRGARHRTLLSWRTNPFSMACEPATMGSRPRNRACGPPAAVALGADAMSGPSFRLHELAQLARVTPRAVRSWIAEGLLPPPVFRGTRTTYDRDHLMRAIAIRLLRERNWK